MDEDWRALDRRLKAEPGDEALVAQAIAARHRAGVPVPRRLALRVTRPGFKLASKDPLGVAIYEGSHVAESHYGYVTVGHVREVPPHVRWFFTPDDPRQLNVGGWPDDDPPALYLFWWPPGADGLESLTWVRELIVGPGADVGDSDLADLEALVQLERLTIQAERVTDAGVVWLNRLRRLTELTLRCPDVGDTALSSLTQLDRLTDLDVRGTRVTARGLARLASLPHLEPVER